MLAQFSSGFGSLPVKIRTDLVLAAPTSVGSGEEITEANHIRAVGNNPHKGSQLLVTILWPVGGLAERALSMGANRSLECPKALGSAVLTESSGWDSLKGLFGSSGLSTRNDS